MKQPATQEKATKPQSKAGFLKVKVVDEDTAADKTRRVVNGKNMNC